MIVDWLIGALVLLAIVSRSPAALVFAGLTAAHSLILGSADGLFYYGSAALTDLVIIMLIAMLPAISSTALTLQRVSLLSLGLNAVGWAMWMLYLPPDIYNGAFLALYAVAIVTLSQRGPTDDLGGDAVGRWRDNLRAVIGASRGRGQAVKGSI